MKRYIRSGKAPEKTEAFYNASPEELRVLALIFGAEEPLSAEELAAFIETLQKMHANLIKMKESEEVE